MNTKVKSFDTFVIIATFSSSITLSLTGNGLIAITRRVVSRSDGGGERPFVLR